ncbi:hypothetical protein HDU97_001901 [Phlyctochytrium planicorne]|nr:hypothetical protein HDU97_001901 [Phlyctochytrium planicorne]
MLKSLINFFKSSQTCSPTSHLLPLTTLRIATYNVWFDGLLQRERAQSLLSLLIPHSLDIICFQEVTQTFLSVLHSTPHYKRNYHICQKGFYPSEGGSWYGIITLVRKTTLRLISEERVAYPNTTQGRCLLVVEVEGNGIPRTKIAQSHFESMQNASIRAEQRSLAAMHARVTGETAHRFGIICGDTNAHGLEETQNAFESVGFTDVWTELKGGEDGATFGVTYGKEKGLFSRLDRIGWHGEGMKAVDVFKIGGEEMDGFEGAFVSDHLGLVGAFEVVKGGNLNLSLRTPTTARQQTMLSHLFCTSNLSSTTQLRVATYNVHFEGLSFKQDDASWYSYPHQSHLSNTLLSKLQPLDLDIICFQEVTMTFLSVLASNHWYRSNYHMLQKGNKISRGSTWWTSNWHGMITLVRKKTFRVVKTEKITLERSRQGVLVVDVEGKDIPRTRISQIQCEDTNRKWIEIVERCREELVTSTVTPTGEHRFEILCGDTRVDELDSVGFTDAWKELKGDKGYEKGRLNRVGWSGEKMKAVDICQLEVVAKEEWPIAGLSASDHVGLVAAFDVVPAATPKT